MVCFLRGRSLTYKEKQTKKTIPLFAAVASLICLFAFAGSAVATVVYTPANVTLSGNGFIKIDLNHDGVTDFLIHSASQTTICGMLGRGALIGGSKITPTIGDGVVVSNAATAAVLASGVPVNASSPFYEARAVITHFWFCRPGSRAVAGYLGLELLINGQIHYGWAQVRIDAIWTFLTPRMSTTLVDFAYETIPGKAIKTGQTLESLSGAATIPESIRPVDVGHAPTGALVSGSTENQQPTHAHYKIVDLGTLGGPNSYVSLTPIPMNRAGTVVGVSETPNPDPFAPYCFVDDCMLAHAFQWREGVPTDLGGLLDGVSGNPNGVNAAGVVAGISETGAVDPQSEFPPQFDAVVWKDGRILDLGTFGGTFSYANAINNRSQVVGFALNGQSDSFFMDECGAGPMPSQMRAFIWEEGSGLKDLGTLGGPDSCALWINQRGELAGHSFTSFTPDFGTGIPAFDPFIWKNGKMTDLGSLGGTQGHASGINSRGQVAGDSNLAGDQTQHAFLWNQGKMQDLTPGRPFAFAHGLNDKGEVVGGLTEDGVSLKGFLWRQGVLTDLESVPGDECDSAATSINSRSQVVGVSFPCMGESHAVIWESGGPATDLNTLVLAGSELQLTEAQFINERGEITGKAVLPDGSQHAFLLIPREQRDDMAISTTPTHVDVAPVTQSPTSATPGQLTPERLAAMRARFHYRNHGFGAKRGKVSN